MPVDVRSYAKLITWTHNPHPVAAIHDILKEMSEEDLLAVARFTNGAAARIAWAEYGHRRGFVKFHIGVSETPAGARLEFEAEGFPITEGPLLRADVEKKRIDES